MDKKRTLVTGASSGIGKELALCFARAGYDLVLVSRQENKLRKLSKECEERYGTKSLIIAKDLSDVCAPKQIFDILEQHKIDVDVLVNNAGFGVYGHFSNTHRETELNMIQLNISALTDLTKLLLAQMLRRRSGKILNVASTAAFQPGPVMAVYFASKAYVLSFSEALAHELKPHGITVTCLCPGPTKTEFASRAAREKELLYSPYAMNADEVAKLAYKGLTKGKTLVIAGFKNKCLIFLQRFLPRSLVRNIVGRIMK
ncbi:MAG: SDR family oxidoreductase [Candidatus Magasanikbacteria bacterium]|nr:SDR family oxidoreductase [Candidatus Magasanikbacteria bacterium]